MPRICFLADAENIHTRKWVDYFSHIHYEIHLISMRNTDYDYGDNVKVYVVEPPGSSKLNYFLIVNKIRKLVREIKPDILHSHYATSYGLYGRMCRVHPFVISVWGSDIYEFPKANIFNKLLLKYILNGADTVCSTSNNMAVETKKYYKKDILITPFGVDVEKFKCTTPIFGRKQIIIGVSKALEKIYGIDYLIEAFGMLLKECCDKDLKLIIVGDGTERENLEALCQRLEISNKVEFIGKVDNKEIPDYINMMDIVCMPSLSESFGVAAVEASACERPVVSTNVGGLEEVVIDGYNGFTLEPGSSESIKDKLKILIYNEELAKSFSRNGRKLVIEKYGWESNAYKVKKLYESLTNYWRKYNGQNK